MIYRRNIPAPVVEQPVERTPERRPEETLVKRPEPPPPVEVADILVRAGTRIPMVFLNDVDTKHSHEGDRIYLHTSFPIVVNSRVVIPRGSAVTGVVTQTKRPGRVSGKGELFIRFDSLTLPNGVTRDLRSRLGSADATAAGQVDPKEGKVTADGNKAGDARKVGTAAGGGASVGVITGGIAGNAGKGAAVGGVAGAAGGLASVLLSRGPDATLRRGTNVEMILDRDLVYRADELR
jgi:type IV secretion system protein VirB10